MISIVRRSTRRRYEDAVETAQRVPGLESELDGQRRKTSELEEKNNGLEQLLEERSETVEKLRTHCGDLRAAGGEIAALMATAPSAAAAGYHAAHVLLAHADQFRLGDTDEGRAGLEAMRELTAPRTVTLLYRYGRRQSVHATLDDARATAARQGAAPDGWGPAKYTNQQGFDAARWLDASWTTTTLTVDAATPWTTPREPLASVYVLTNGVMPCAAFSTRADAIREQDRLGIPHTADSLVRMELAASPAPAAIYPSHTRSGAQPAPAL